MDERTEISIPSAPDGANAPPPMAMCQRVFVEIIYMLPNCSEHKANCLTVKADCMFTV